MCKIPRSRILVSAYLAILLAAVLIFRASAATTTSTVSVTTSAYLTLTANSDCRYVQIMEDAQAGTTNYLVKAPATGNTAITVPAGKIFTFSGPFQFGATVGFVKTSTANVTFDQVETN